VRQPEHFESAGEVRRFFVHDPIVNSLHFPPVPQYRFCRRVHAIWKGWFVLMILVEGSKRAPTIAPLK
jgi:hypothetical protein